MEKILKKRHNIIYVVPEEEGLNSDFCERFYGKKEFFIIFFKNHKTRKFDSDSNVFESTNSKEFFEILEATIENKKIAIVAIDNPKISEEELIKYENQFMNLAEKMYVFSDQEVKNMKFEIS